MSTNIGAGGASGAYIEKVIAVTGGSPYNYTCGAGGAGGAAGDNDGSAGTDSTFVVGATTYTAKGGAGGNARLADIGILLGPSGGTSTNGDINGIGIPGVFGILIDAAGHAGASGSGGTPALGVGIGGDGATDAAAGINGSGYAAGGSGAMSTAATPGGDRAGGDGSDGFWIVEEYK